MASIDPKYDAAFQRGYVEPEPEPERARRNPWLIVLWSLGVVLLVGGIVALWHAQVILASPNLGNEVTYYVLPYVLEALAPWFVGAGLAAVVSAVVVHAVRWR